MYQANNCILPERAYRDVKPYRGPAQVEVPLTTENITAAVATLSVPDGFSRRMMRARQVLERVRANRKPTR
jgi:hypothetical protein